jgi:hypothetical protein
LTEVFRPQILIMALPSLPRDGRIVVSTIHRFAKAENKPCVPAKAGTESATRWSCKTRCKEQPQNKETAPTTISHTLGLRSARVHGGCIRTTKKPERISPGLLGAALLNTLFWKILVTRVNGKSEARRDYPSYGRHARSRTQVNPAGALLRAA